MATGKTTDSPKKLKQFLSEITHTVSGVGLLLTIIGLGPFCFTAYTILKDGQEAVKKFRPAAKENALGGQRILKYKKHFSFRTSFVWRNSRIGG
jgi:predicted PurR-regulated permease PerM